MTQLLAAMALALALTALVEGAAMLAYSRRPRFVYYTLLCNLLTNPALNLTLVFAARLHSAPAYHAILALLELAAVALEGWVLALLCRWPAKKAVAVSLALNSLSFGAGLVFNMLVYQ